MVIRLPALTSEVAAEPVETVEAVEAVSAPPVSPLDEPVASEPARWAPAPSSTPVAPSATEDMTTFAIPHAPVEPASPAKATSSPAVVARPPEPAATAAAKARELDPLEISVSRTPAAHRSVAGSGLVAAWRIVRRGHAFVMQPKVWLACVLGCFAVLLAAFLSTPPAEPADSPNPAPGAPTLEAEAEPPADVAARIVAPPADMQPAADSRHFEFQSSAGFAGPLGQSPAGEIGEGAAGSPPDEALRIASEAKLGPGGSRYDGQSPAVEQRGAALYDVAPLDRSDEIPSEGSSLR
jgi:hypothetical protein